MGGIWWTSSPCRQRTGRLCAISREEFAPNVSASSEGGSVGALVGPSPLAGPNHSFNYQKSAVMTPLRLFPMTFGS